MQRLRCCCAVLNLPLLLLLQCCAQDLVAVRLGLKSGARACCLLV
jgi:hypothetical protein